jgi:hypothetical protein
LIGRNSDNTVDYGSRTQLSPIARTHAGSRQVQAQIDPQVKNRIVSTLSKLYQKLTFS